MKYLQWLKAKMPELSPKRREIFATFLLNLAVASFAVAAFEGKWWGIIPAVVFMVAAIYMTKGI